MSDAVTFLVSEYLPGWIELAPDRLRDECPIRLDWLRGCSSTNDGGTDCNPRAVTLALSSARTAIVDYVEYEVDTTHGAATMAGISETAAYTWSGMHRIVWSTDDFVQSAQWAHLSGIVRAICQYQAWRAADGPAQLRHRTDDAAEQMRAACLELCRPHRERARAFAKEQIASGIESVELEALAEKPIEAYMEDDE